MYEQGQHTSSVNLACTIYW